MSEEQAWRERAKKAEAFKAWTHAYLDKKGVPSVVEDEHLAAGCRIGGRMDWVFAQLAAKDAELARLRGVVEKLKKFYDLYENSGSWSSEQKPPYSRWLKISQEESVALELAADEVDAALALPSPAEAGEKPLSENCQDPQCVFFGWHYMMHPGGKVCPPAAPSDAKAAERPCRCGRPEYPGVIHRADAGCIADPTWKR
jgi:hypothetical protein